MKKTFAAISLIFLWFQSAVTGQNFETDWEKQLGGPAIHSFADVIENNDGTYTVLGFIEKKGSTDPDLWLLKFSNSGDTLQTFIYKREGHDDPVRLHSLSDGGYLLAAINGTPESGLVSWVLRISPQGEEQWRVDNAGEIFAARTDIAVNPDDTWWWLNTSGPGEVKLTHMDQGGKVQSEYKFAEEQPQQAHALRLLPDGTLAASGQIDQGKGTSTIWVMRINQQGEKIWKSFVPGSSKKITPECICCTSDNHLMVAGWTGTSMNPDAAPEDQIFDFDLLMTKIDATGKIIWTKNYDREGSEGGNAVAVRPDGNILVAGRCATSFTGTVGPWLIYTDKSGKMLKDQVDKFRFNGDQASRIINTSDGGFLMVGPGKLTGDLRRSAGWIKKFKP
jgi:hypothetical protein